MKHQRYEKPSETPSSLNTLSEQNVDENTEEIDDEKPSSCAKMIFTKWAEKFGLLDRVAPRPDQKKTKGSEKGQPLDQAALERQQRLEAENYRKNRLRAQLKAEEQAGKYNQYAPHQRVRYHFRATDTWYDAAVVAIHLDDGPDKPYYTIKYNKVQKTQNSKGDDVEEVVAIEKQTDPDRLQRVPWDENKTWEILQ